MLWGPSGFRVGTPKMGGEGYGSLRLLQRTMEAMAPGKSTERKRACPGLDPGAVDSDGLGKTLVDIQYERSSQDGAFSPALGKRLRWSQDGAWADGRRVSHTAHSPDDDSC